MDKRLLLIVGAVLVLIAGGVAYLMMAPEGDGETEDEPATATQTTQEPAAGEPEAADTDAAQTGRYVDYDEAEVAATEGTKVLFFHAPWCPQCRALESSIQASAIPENVTIFRVDYDSNQALRQQYGVTIQTTLVTVDAQGNLVERYVAYDEPNFAAVKENLLD